jgi:hypothetical protein
MSGHETQFVVTCDYDWQEHGDDKGYTPADVFSLAEAKRVGAAHGREFPEHQLRIWRFQQRYVPNMQKKQS